MAFPNNWASGEKITASKLNAWNDKLSAFEKLSPTAAAARVAAVGFGTDAPQHPVHVNTSEAWKGFRADRNGAPFFSVYSDASGNGEMALATAGGQNTVVLRAGGDSFFTGGRLGVGSGLTSILSTVFQVHSPSLSGPGLEVGHLLITAVASKNRMLMGLHQTSSIYGYIQVVENGVTYRNLALNPVGGSVSIGGYDPATRLDVNGAVTLRPDSTPANPSASSEARLYVKGGKLVVQYNDAGTVRYKYLDLTGTGTSWVHSTTAP